MQVFSIVGKQGCSEQSGDFFRALSASVGQTAELHGAGRRPKLGTLAAAIMHILLAFLPLNRNG